MVETSSCSFFMVTCRPVITSRQSSVRKPNKSIISPEWTVVALQFVDGTLQKVDIVDQVFCPIRSHIHLVPNKHTEAYISYKLIVLLAQASY